MSCKVIKCYMMKRTLVLRISRKIVQPHSNSPLRLTSFLQYYISNEDFTKDMEDFRSDQIFAPGAAVEEEAVAYVVVVP